MDDHDDRPATGQSILVATTLATLVLAGSAALLRSKLPQIRFLPYASQNHHAEESEERDATEHRDQAQSSSFKSSRSKERRRRGKDPMKELMKGGKKAKDIAKLLKNVELGGNPSAGPSSASSSTSTYPQQHPQQLPEPVLSRYSKRTRSPDASVSSRSVSSVSVASSSQHTRNADVDSRDDSDDDDCPSQIPDKELYSVDMEYGTLKDLPDISSQRPSRADSHYTDPRYIYSTRSGQPSTAPLTHSSSHSHSTSHDSTPSVASLATSLSSTDSVATASTAITSVGSMSQFVSLKQYDYEQQEEETEEQRNSTPTRNHIPSSKSYPSKSSKDSVHNANDTFTPSRKPPRFRTRNNNSSPSQSHSELPSSVSLPIMTPRNSTSTSFSSCPADNVEQHGHDTEMPVPIDFPTLNSSINNSAINGSRSGDSEPTSSAIHIDGLNEQSNGHGSTSRRVPTPRRTPTPSVISGSSQSNLGSGSGTGSPGGGSGINSGRCTPPQSQSASSSSSTVSTQTQIASLKGALEAARMREEKTKGDLERYAKEVEMLRWESAVWRRRENELHAHIHHLMHQLQSYAAFYMSGIAMSPPAMQSPPNGTQPLHLQHLAVPEGNGSPPGSNNGSNAPSPSPNAHQQVPLPGSAPGTPGSQASGLLQQSQPAQENGSALPNGTGLISQPPLPPQTNEMLTSPMSPLGTMSPLSFSMVSSPHSPHFPYPPYPIPGQPPHGQVRSPFGIPMPLQMHPSHFLSMLNVNPMSTSTSVSSALSMNVTSGEEDLSPDPSMNSSPSPGPKAALDRGRKKVKKSENGNVLASSVGELGDGWVGIPRSADMGDEASASGSSERYNAEREDEDDAESDDDGGVSSLLADAILKRPEAMRLGSGRKKFGRGGKHEKTEASDFSSSPGHSTPGTPGSSESLQPSSSSESPVEFVFPSISDWGNVTKKRTDVTVEQVQEEKDSEVEETTPPAVATTHKDVPNVVPVEASSDVLLPESVQQLEVQTANVQ